MVRIIVALVALLAASSAQADWQYRRWGMTVEELLASGKGISTIDQQEAARQRLGSNLGSPVARADVTNDLRFTAYFFLRNGTLAGVRLVGSPDQKYEIQGQLERTYGKPLQTQNDAIPGNCRILSSTWRDEPGKNSIMFSAMACLPSQAMGSAAVLYQPLLSKRDSGL